MKGTGEPPGADDRTTTSPTERPTMAEHPLLIIESSGRGSPIHYQCSQCRRPFRMADDASPKAAAEEMYRRFREHVAEEHA